MGLLICFLMGGMKIGSFNLRFKPILNSVSSFLIDSPWSDSESSKIFWIRDKFDYLTWIANLGSPPKQKPTNYSSSF
jgi:hypothetical protein